MDSLPWRILYLWLFWEGCVGAWVITFSGVSKQDYSRGDGEHPLHRPLRSVRRRGDALEWRRLSVKQHVTHVTETHIICLALRHRPTGAEASPPAAAKTRNHPVT